MAALATFTIPALRFYRGSACATAAEGNCCRREMGFLPASPWITGLWIGCDPWQTSRLTHTQLSPARIRG